MNIRQKKAFEKFRVMRLMGGLTNINGLLNAPRQVKLAAIKRNYRAIEAMAFPSEELQCAAVQEDVRALEYITYPCKKARILAKLLS
jgi:hypothetical protein